MNKMLPLNFSPFPVLNNTRVLLRQLKEADAEALFALRSNPAMSEYITRVPYSEIEQARKFIRNINQAIANDESLLWAITLQGEDKLIGTVCLFHISTENHRAEIGYEIAPEQQGKGLVQEAVQAMIDYAFNFLKFHSLEAVINPDNAASIKVVEKLGFLKEAHFKQNTLWKGKYLDSAVYSLVNRTD